MATKGEGEKAAAGEQKKVRASTCKFNGKTYHLNDCIRVADDTCLICTKTGWKQHACGPSCKRPTRKKKPKPKPK